MRSSPALPVVLLALALSGCARAVLESSVVDGLEGDAMELEFWQRIEAQRILTTNDALHGLLLVAGDDRHATWDERLAAARRRGWVAAGADPVADESAPVGLVAVAACEILGIEGGLTMRLLGPSPRLCTRELVYLDILPLRTEHQSLSGLEFIDLVRRIEDRLEERGEVE